MSAVAVMDQRPPYVRFEERSVEDRDETIKLGRQIFRSQYIAILHPVGSKDTIEHVAEGWLDELDRKAQRGLYNREWARQYRQMFDQFKIGQEPTVSGTHVRMWASISKAQADNLVGANCLTVEDLAVANEQTLQRIGMGSRALKQKAKDWLTMADGRKGAEELSAVKAENASLRSTVEALQETVSRLSAKLDSKTKE